MRERRSPSNARFMLCAICGNSFEMRFAFQVITLEGARRAVCSETCRGISEPKAPEPKRAVAVLHPKNGELDLETDRASLERAEEVWIPISCDALAISAVKQILRIIRQVNEALPRRIDVFVLPTDFDPASASSKQTVQVLESYFKGCVLPPVLAVEKCLATAKSQS